MLLSFWSFAQQDFKDTTWLNQHMMKCEKAQASFYRIHKKTGKSYVVYEKDLSGDVKMISEASGVNPVVLEGYTVYYENGVMTSRGYRKQGNKTGVWTNYYGRDSSLYTVNPDGTSNYLRRSELQKADIFSIIEVQPEFPGGTGAMMKFLGENTKYPEEMNKLSVGGKVFLKFVIDETGQTTNIEVLQSSGVLALDEEARRVISAMPKWTPGKMSQRPVKCYFTLPMNFSIKDPYFVFNVHNSNENYLLAKKAVLSNELDSALNYYYKDFGDIDAWYNMAVIFYLKKNKDESKKYFENVVSNSDGNNALYRASKNFLNKNF